MKVKPAGALDLQFDLMRWWRSSDGARYAEGWASSSLSTDYTTEDLNQPIENRAAQHLALFQSNPALQVQALRLGKQLLDREASSLYRSKTFWMHPDMCLLVAQAAEKMAPQPLKQTDPPAPFGFMYLARPLHVTDISDEICSIQALRWSEATDAGPSMAYHAGHPVRGISIGVYTGWDDPADLGSQELKRRQEREGYRLPPLAFFGNEPWAYGKDFLDITRENYHGKLTDQAFDLSLKARGQTLRFLASAWAIMQQTIVKSRPVADMHDEPPARAQRRRLERQGLLTDTALEGIKVVTLRRRRTEGEDAEPTGDTRRYTHRFVVEGHWRNQWYPSLNAHRQIWIDDYVKGPEDAPLIEKNTIYKVSR